MKYLLSMDGGGSKTAWVLTTIDGEKVATHRCGGCSHPLIGIDGVLHLISDTTDLLLQQVGITREDLAAASFGIPCFGEYPEADRKIDAGIHAMFSCPINVVNDAELGMAGSLCLSAGIHIVAGTGAFAIGRDPSGKTARSNGWHPTFSDEGSGYWLGMQTLALFCKQGDGRAPRGALYDIMLKELPLTRYEDIVPYYDEVISGDRKRTAALQEILHRAALAGDEEAVALYRRSAKELFLSVKALYDTLDFTTERSVKVSYSGGLFAVGELLLEPFLESFLLPSINVVPPALSPVMGGILLAMNAYCPERSAALTETLKTLYSKEVLS